MMKRRILVTVLTLILCMSLSVNVFARNASESGRTTGGSSGVLTTYATLYADYDYGKVSLAFEDHAKNSLDMLHGGALFTLADMAFGLASNFGQEDGTMISTNATISYMKSAKTGPIVAEARLANGGRHLATYEVKIYDGQGTYIACAMISGYRLDTKLAIEE